MKNILIILSLTLGLFSSYAFAGGGCYQDPIREVNYMAKITTAANVRDRPCMAGTKVMSVAYLGETVQVIADNDGWIQIKRSNGTIGRVGTWLTTRINQTPPKAPVNTDGLYTNQANNTTPTQDTNTTKYNNYYPIEEDEKFLKKIYDKINIIADKYSNKLESMLEAIKTLKKKYSNKARLNYLLGQIETYLEGKIDIMEVENLFNM